MPDDAYKSTPTVQEKFHLQSNTQEQLQGCRTFHKRIQRLLVDPMAICEKKCKAKSCRRLKNSSLVWWTMQCLHDFNRMTKAISINILIFPTIKYRKQVKQGKSDHRNDYEFHINFPYPFAFVICFSQKSKWLAVLIYVQLKCQWFC